jgi:hypothetical protein
METAGFMPALSTAVGTPREPAMEEERSRLAEETASVRSPESEAPLRARRTPKEPLGP